LQQSQEQHKTHTTAATSVEDPETFCWWRRLLQLWHQGQMMPDGQQTVHQQWEA